LTPADYDILTKNYSARITDTGKVYRYYTTRPVFPSYTNYSIDDPTITIQPKTERVIAVEMLESNVARLANDLNSIDEIRERGILQYQRNIDKEMHLRVTNKAVKKAYEQYRMVLRLAAEGDINNTG
jgi:hypothetical protein